MAGYLPTGFPFVPPPPPRSLWSPPPPPPWHRPFSPDNVRDNNGMSPGGVIAGAIIGVGTFLLVLTFVCSLWRGYRNSRANVAADAAAAARALAARQAPLDSDRDDDGRTQHASPTAGLPSFTYNQAVRHNVTGSGDEAATCSVCLGAFQVVETVRLLPVCLHLYHVECIDPWLEAHSTCPLCRSGTEDPTMHGGLLPPFRRARLPIQAFTACMVLHQKRTSRTVRIQVQCGRYRRQRNDAVFNGKLLTTPSALVHKSISLLKVWSLLLKSKMKPPAEEMLHLVNQCCDVTEGWHAKTVKRIAHS